MKALLIPIILLVRILDINRHLNSLFGRIEISYADHEKDFTKTTVQLFVVEWYGFLPFKKRGVGMSMDDLVTVVADIANTPKGVRYGAKFTLQHPTDDSLSYEIPAWATGKLFNKAYRACATYQLLKTISEAAKEAQAEIAQQELDSEVPEQKPVLH